MPDVKFDGLVIFIQMGYVFDFKCKTQVILVRIVNKFMLGGDAGNLNLIEVADAFALGVWHEIEELVERNRRREFLAREICLGLAIGKWNDVFVWNETNKDVL